MDRLTAYSVDARKKKTVLVSGDRAGIAEDRKSVV